MVKKVISIIVMIIATTGGVAAARRPVMITAALSGTYAERVAIAVFDAFSEDFRVVDVVELTQDFRTVGLSDDFGMLRHIGIAAGMSIPELLDVVDFVMLYKLDTETNAFHCRIVSRDNRWTIERCEFTQAGLGRMEHSVSRWVDSPRLDLEWFDRPGNDASTMRYSRRGDYGRRLDNTRRRRHSVFDSPNHENRQNDTPAGITPVTSAYAWAKDRKNKKNAERTEGRRSGCGSSRALDR